MIYAQPGMTKTKVIGNDGFDGVLGEGNKVYVTITKPLPSLCLLSKKFSDEYIKVCEDKEKLFIRTSQFVHKEGHTKMWEDEDIKTVKFLDFHLGDWTLEKHALADFRTFQRWLKDLFSQMPCLRSVKFKLYVDGVKPKQKDMLEGWLRSMASFKKFEQLKVVEYDIGPQGEDFCWDLRGNNHKLLVHWRAGDVTPPAIMDPAPDYTESCCDGLEYGERMWDDDSEFDYDRKYIGDDEDRCDEYAEYA
jgi:hypothetical protein